jgi:hypothetical protein
MRKPWNVRVATVGAALAVMMVTSTASAQDSKAKDNTPRGVITLAEITITGRIQKPIAAVDVARIRPKLTLSELRQPFLERIHQAIFKDPF